MNWYKQSANFGYHGTSPGQLPSIKASGLRQGTFFASNESDCSSYADGAIIRFPFPQKSQKRTGRGDYYTTLQNVPSSTIQVKLGAWGNWKKL